MCLSAFQRLDHSRILSGDLPFIREKKKEKEKLVLFFIFCFFLLPLFYGEPQSLGIGFSCCLEVPFTIPRSEMVQDLRWKPSTFFFCNNFFFLIFFLFFFFLLKSFQAYKKKTPQVYLLYVLALCIIQGCLWSIAACHVFTITYHYASYIFLFCSFLLYMEEVRCDRGVSVGLGRGGRGGCSQTSPPPPLSLSLWVLFSCCNQNSQMSLVPAVSMECSASGGRILGTKKCALAHLTPLINNYYFFISYL